MKGEVWVEVVYVLKVWYGDDPAPSEEEFLERDREKALKLGMAEARKKGRKVKLVKERVERKIVEEMEL